MGLCKCPKRQVTNQFCFEHRVNVCENCMVTSHPKCIVQSYINWLKDSDYVSLCSLCNGSLEEGDCVRLICYHIFHWNCLNERQSTLPTHTAPGAHTCPTCFAPIFPPGNLVSPVCDTLKAKLKQANWGKNELGQPMFSENISNLTSQSIQPKQVTKIHHSNVEKNKINNNGDGTLYNNNNQIGSSSPHSVLLMDAFNPSTSADSNSRRSYISKHSSSGSDRDDNKYRKRTPAEIFSRWSRRFYAPSSRPPWRRTWFLVLSGLITFIIIVYLMAHFGRASSSTSSDEWNNPNRKAMPVQNEHY